MSSAPASVSTSRGQQEQPSSDRAAKRALPSKRRRDCSGPQSTPIGACHSRGASRPGAWGWCSPA
eukprot:14927961-Alexandrium_andersonii.AAC.1